MAREIYKYLQQRGASFFTDMVRTVKFKVPSWPCGEPVTAGLLTADGFDNLRALIDPKHRAGHGPHRKAEVQSSWSLLLCRRSRRAISRTRKQFAPSCSETCGTQKHSVRVTRSACHVHRPRRSRRGAAKFGQPSSPAGDSRCLWPSSLSARCARRRRSTNASPLAAADPRASSAS